MNATDEFIKKLSAKKITRRLPRNESLTTAEQLEYMDIPTACELVRLLYSQMERFSELDPSEIEDDSMMPAAIVKAALDMVERCDELSLHALGITKQNDGDDC